MSSREGREAAVFHCGLRTVRAKISFNIVSGRVHRVSSYGIRWIESNIFFAVLFFFCSIARASAESGGQLRYIVLENIRPQMRVDSQQ